MAAAAARAPKPLNPHRAAQKRWPRWESERCSASAQGLLSSIGFLGGGLVPGSLVLVGGDPGIGKSTLLLQTAADLAQRQSVLYVSAEESAQQVKLRWQRLAAAGGGGDGPQLLAETDLEQVLAGAGGFAA